MTTSRSRHSPARITAWVLFGLAFAIQVGLGLAVHSGTCDELGAHLPAGVLAWKTGRPGSGLANPPLGQMLVAAGPVLSGGADDPLRQSPADLLPARLPVVWLGVLAVLVTAQVGARLAGATAALAAAGAAVLSPDLIAHSGLATLDLPVTTFWSLAALLAWRWVREGSPRYLAGWAVCAATACLVKTTALHLLPAVALGAALLPGAGTVRLARAGTLLATGAVALAASAWLVYGPGPAKALLPAAFVEAVVGKLGQSERGHFSYLLGRRSADGFPEYYLVALAAKTPLALQLSALAGGWALLRRRISGDRAGFAAFFLVPAMWLLVSASLVHRVHIGVRHVLPILPALLALAGAGWAFLAGAGRGGRAAAGLLALWAVTAAIRITPDHLAYFHELAGGPDHGDALLIDSNLDWGQDEGRFRVWARGNPVVVNPDRPASGLVAANVNAIRGIFAWDDLRLRWLRRLEPARTFGHTFRVYEVREEPLRAAANGDSLATLDYAWWLLGVGRAAESLEAIEGLERTGLPRDPTHGRGYWRVRGEALLTLGRLAEAREAAERAGDADLAGEIDYRRRLVDGTTLGPAQAARAVRALARRGHREEASRLGIETFGTDPLATPSHDLVPRWTEAGRLKALGQERAALETVARALAVDPSNEDALWLYGELVVRRKLGLTEYPWPSVDWSNVASSRGRAESPARSRGRRGGS